jgi:hypothetical protein
MFALAYTYNRDAFQQCFRTSVADPNPKLFAASESEFGFVFGFGSNYKRLMEIMQANVIIMNRSKNHVITEVRASILLVHLHAKRIADTIEKLYFLFHFCRIRIRKKMWIRIRIGSATLFETARFVHASKTWYLGRVTLLRKN